MRNRRAGQSSFVGGLIFLLFIVLFIMKVTGVEPVTSWSWWIIFTPLLFGLGMGIIGAAILYFVIIQRSDRVFDLLEKKIKPR